MTIRHYPPPERKVIRACDGCTECCWNFSNKELGIATQEKCIHADPGGVGCLVFETDDWPLYCHKFQCHWTLAAPDGTPIMDEGMKPDKVNALVTGAGDPEAPRSIRIHARIDQKVHPKVLAYALEMSHKCDVVLYHGDDNVTGYRGGVETIPHKVVRN